ncbi:hypothetical protein J1605_022699 [Eschrichtius robustus]|uniref:Uncharacterized protein n=1 Tax=Eschrichtius robustus TaxID=9764 RepID=A0AB34HA76_ESCRO|nr:hypothetical protein J1605_022699 [Eschrichtius robustus]
MRRARSRPPGLQLPEEFAGGRRRRTSGAILKSDPQSLSLCVSRGRPLVDREPSQLKGRTLRTPRLVGETAGGDMAGSERGLRCCHSASP